MPTTHTRVINTRQWASVITTASMPPNTVNAVTGAISGLDASPNDPKTVQRVILRLLIEKGTNENDAGIWTLGFSKSTGSGTGSNIDRDVVYAQLPVVGSVNQDVILELDIQSQRKIEQSINVMALWGNTHMSGWKIAFSAAVLIGSR